MGRSRAQDGHQAADWQTDPGDKAALVSFLHGIRSRIGQGGNWDRTALNEAAAFMAQRGPPQKGGPKTADSIRTQFAAVRLPIVHFFCIILTPFYS